MVYYEEIYAGSIAWTSCLLHQRYSKCFVNMGYWRLVHPRRNGRYASPEVIARIRYMRPDFDARLFGQYG